MSELVRLDDGTEAHLFRPAGRAGAGAVIVLHERYGLVQHTLDLWRPSWPRLAMPPWRRTCSRCGRATGRCCGGATCA